MNFSLLATLLATLNKLHMNCSLEKVIDEMIEIRRNDGSTCPEVFCKKDVLRNFAKFTGKQLRQSLLFNKVAGLRPKNTFS